MVNKLFKKSIVMLLVITMVMGSAQKISYAAAKSKAAAVSNADGKILSIDLKNKTAEGKVSYTTKAYVFVPAGVNVGERAAMSPAIVVYGDKDYTEASALKAAQTSGIGEIVKKEEGVALFVNSANKTWSQADTESLAAVISLNSNKEENNIL